MLQKAGLCRCPPQLRTSGVLPPQHDPALLTAHPGPASLPWPPGLVPWLLPPTLPCHLAVTLSPVLQPHWSFLVLGAPQYWFGFPFPSIWSATPLLVSLASITNSCNELHGLHHIHSLSSCPVGEESARGLTGLRSKCRPGCIHFWRLQGRTHCLACPTCRGHCIPGLITTSSIFKASHSASF